MENKLIDDCMKLGFGMMRLPRVEGTNTIDLEHTKRMVDAFIAVGGKYFDTAYIYEGSEEATKAALCDRYPRESYYLADKLNGSDFAAKSEEEAKNEIRVSLERTGAGYIDFYLLHGIDEGNIGNFNRYGIWDYMKKLKADGLIRHYGFSFHSTPEHLDQLLTDHPDAEFVQLQINYADWEDPLICSRGQSTPASEGYPATCQSRCVVCLVGRPICGFAAERDGGAQRHVEHGADGR